MRAMRGLAVLGVFAVVTSVAVAAAPYGDRSAAFRVVFDVKSGNNVVSATVDVVAINQGAVDAAVIFGSAGQPEPARFEQQIVGKVAARIGKS
jgi:hypothetical protein